MSAWMWDVDVFWGFHVHETWGIVALEQRRVDAVGNGNSRR